MEIIPAGRLWAGQKNRTEFENACNEVMDKIKNASKEGKRCCLFDPRPTDFYSSVKEEFIKNGYRFEPYGVSGGVRQDCENICW